MRTGILDEPIKPNRDFQDRIGCMMLVLMEKAFGNAAYYTKEAGRSTVTSTDLKMALMYECHEFASREDIEDQFAKVWNETQVDSDVSDESESGSDDDEADEPFSFAKTDDALVIKMNTYWDTWDSWEPSDSVQVALKKAIDSY